MKHTYWPVLLLMHRSDRCKKNHYGFSEEEGRCSRHTDQCYFSLTFDITHLPLILGCTLQDILDAVGQEGNT